MRKIRERIYFAVEGDSEQSFVKLLQRWADEFGLFVYLDAQIMAGGGYKIMLEEAVKKRRLRQRTKGEHAISILLVDSDRAEKGDDPWTLAHLETQARKHHFELCLQKPNHEGLLFRMLRGCEQKTLAGKDAEKKLKKAWPTYEKPADFYTLSAKFTHSDLMRVATVDLDIKKLLRLIGFESP